MALSLPLLPPLPPFQNYPSPSRLPRLGASAAEFPENMAVPVRPSKPRRTVAGVDQDSLLDPEALADSDSLFFEFNGVRLHHKVAVAHHEQDTSGDISSSSSSRTSGFPMILLHGFGASLFSWNRVLRPLARIAGAKVVAFDRPAFGLTSRGGKVDGAGLNPYSMAFSVMATLLFIEKLGAEKAILVGHSAGCLVAVNAYFEAPERVAALILVAPAIFAPLRVKFDEEKRGGNGSRRGDVGEDSPIVRVWKGVCQVFVNIARMVLQVLAKVRDVMSLIFRKLVCALLRSALAVILLRFVMDKFGVAGVRNSWYDGSKISRHVIEGYTKPLRVKGWEKALLEYTVAMLNDSDSKTKPPLATRLSTISCPVLIVTGDTDRLVPSSNAMRLSKAIPGSTVEIIKNCGHLPHEERVEEFLSIVDGFLQRIFGAHESQFAMGTT